MNKENLSPKMETGLPVAAEQPHNKPLVKVNDSQTKPENQEQKPPTPEIIKPVPEVEVRLSPLRKSKTVTPNNPELKIDPEFQALLGDLSKEEHDQLEVNIKSEGCREAIITWNGFIIEGHNRYEICMKNNIPFKTLAKEFKSRDDVINWIIDNQLGRRNVSKHDRKMLLGKKYNREKANVTNKSGKNQHSKPSTVDNQNDKQPETTAERIAKETRTSPASIVRAGVYQESVETISKSTGMTTQELGKTITGNKIPEAMVNEIAKAPPESQKGMVETAKEKKPSKPKARTMVKTLPANTGGISKDSISMDLTMTGTMWKKLDRFGDRKPSIAVPKLIKAWEALGKIVKKHYPEIDLINPPEPPNK